MPSVLNGSAHISDTIKEEEHHTGPELQRTGRSVCLAVQDSEKITCTCTCETRRQCVKEKTSGSQREVRGPPGVRV